MPRRVFLPRRVPRGPIPVAVAALVIGAFLGSSIGSASTARFLSNPHADTQTQQNNAKPAAGANASNDRIGFSRPRLALPLRIRGNAVVDARGHVVVLGGVHRVGYETATGDDISSREADSVARWATMVRLEVSSALLADRCAYAGSAWLTRLDNAVRALTRRNVVALIDLHQSAPQTCLTDRRLPLPARAEATKFWHTIAARYARNPLVAFELWNEPHGVSTQQWLSGGLIADKNAGVYEAEGMQAMYATVAKVSRYNLIVVDGNGYAGDPTPITDSVLTYDARRTVFAMHIYTCTDANDTLCMANPTKRTFPRQSVERAGWDSLAARLPVIMTETGFPDQKDGTWMRSVAAWAKSHSPAIGVVGFANNGAWGGSPFAILNPKAQWAPNKAGAALVSYMRSVAPTS